MQQPNAYNITNTSNSLHNAQTAKAAEAAATTTTKEMEMRARHCKYTLCDLSGDICVLFVRMNIIRINVWIECALQKLHTHMMRNRLFRFLFS